MKTKHIVLLAAVAVVAWFIFRSAPAEEQPNLEENTEEATEETSELQMKEAEEDTEKMTEETETTNTTKNDEFTLSAESLGDGKVKFSWSLPEDIETDDEKGFIIVRSENENPENDGLNYWIRQSSLNREASWINIPTGTQHFRICALLNEECAVYSNDIELEVK